MAEGPSPKRTAIEVSSDEERKELDIANNDISEPDPTESSEKVCVCNN